MKLTKNFCSTGPQTEQDRARYKAQLRAAWLAARCKMRRYSTDDALAIGKSRLTPPEFEQFEKYIKQP